MKQGYCFLQYNPVAAIREGHISATEVLEAHINKHNPALNAVITMDVERACERAHEADKALAHGHVWGPLHGVPITPGI